MLTRIEIDGFKTFEGFKLDLGPLTVVLGSNASGKSNLFDAIRLLSNLATQDLRHSFRTLRGEVAEVFRRHPRPAERMSFAIEVLLQPEVDDPWGRQVELRHTRIRYEVVIERREDPRGLERLNVVREEAVPILRREDRWVSGRAIDKGFRARFLRYSRREPFLVTHLEDIGEPRFEIRQDGKAGRPFPASAAEATVLSTVTTTDFPHLFALREELRSWRFLQLDPAALRRPSPFFGVAEALEPDGSNLAYVLARIKAETSTEEQPRGSLSEITAELASIIPGVVDLNVTGDRLGSDLSSDRWQQSSSREYRIDIALKGGVPFSSRVVSDGTLRVLALLTVLHDPRHRGLLLFEEPENGIHPARLKTLIDRLRNLVTNPNERQAEAPLSQLIMNSHSPVVLSSLLVAGEGVTPDVVFASLVSIVDPSNEVSYPTTRMRTVSGKEQDSLEFVPDRMSLFEVERYLSTVNASGI